jgi:hypothetical protein
MKINVCLSKRKMLSKSKNLNGDGALFRHEQDI